MSRAKRIHRWVAGEERDDAASAHLRVRAVLGDGEAQARAETLGGWPCEDRVAGEERAARLMEQEHRSGGVPGYRDRAEAMARLAVSETRGTHTGRIPAPSGRRRRLEVDQRAATSVQRFNVPVSTAARSLTVSFHWPAMLAPANALSAKV